MPKDEGLRAHHTSHLAQEKCDQDLPHQTENVLTKTHCPPEGTSPIWLPSPLGDHLLHLIQFNAFRALRSNKVFLDTHTTQLRPSGTGARFDLARYPAHSVRVPLAPDRLGCLALTVLQMQAVHSSWIDVLPCPLLRDNLIKHQRGFSHAEFVADLVGDLIDPGIFSSGSVYCTSALANRYVVRGSEADAEEGLIVWGEPYLTDSWEVTAAFRRKWGWAMRGCLRLIESSNYWRSVRGEGPLRYALGM